MGPSWLNIFESVMRWVFAFGGWGVAFLLWKFRKEQARRIADHAEVSRAIDTALDQLEKFESLVIEFWSDSDSRVIPQQLSSSMATCIFYIMQVSRLSPNREYPASNILSVRKNATLNMEQDSRGFNEQRDRLARFVSSMAKLRKSGLFHKQPFSG